MKKTNEARGITLIALVITIIVLLILAGISIMMLTGDNSILNQAINAKESTVKGSEQEAISVAYHGVLTNNLGSVKEGETFRKELEDELKKNGQNVEVKDNGKTVEFKDTKNIYKLDIAKGTVAKKEQQDRSKIEVGDYVEYTPPTRENYSAYLIEDYTGSTKNTSIEQQYKIWRVLNKNDDGTLDLIPAFKDSGVTYTDVYFNDAKGYNNSVYILHDICKALYEKTNSDIDKAITARSLDYEDITKLLVTNEDGKGIKKIESYQTTQIGYLKTDAQSRNSYITKKDGNKITYKERTWYPVLYRNLADNLTNVLTNESDYFYKSKEDFESSAKSNGKIADKPTNLEVEYTNYYGTMNATDFADYDDKTGKSKKQEVIFLAETNYWLASRYVTCDSTNGALFGIRRVNNSNLNGGVVFYSYDGPSNRNNRVCPIVTLGSDVPVTSNSGTNEDGKRHVVVIPE